jgi:flagellar protein FliO/FliZ
VVLLEVADQWVLIGVAPGQVRSLATLPKGQLTDLPAPGLMNPGFAQVLQRFKERRDAR